MHAFWSGRDDEGELGVPGLHCTVGQLTQDSFEICASVVQNRKRYVFDPLLFLDVPERDTKSTGEKTQSRIIRLSSLKVHPNVHKYVTQRTAAITAGKGKGATSWGKAKKANDFADFNAMQSWRNSQSPQSYEDWYNDYLQTYGLDAYWEGDDYRYGLKVDPVNDSVESIQLELEEMYGATSTSFTKGFLLEGKYLQEVPEEEKFAIKQDAMQLRQLIKRLGQTDLGHLWFIKLIAEELGVVIDPAIEDTLDHHYYYPTK